MNNLDFCYWLQGYFELTEVRGEDVKSLAQVQIKCIRDHIREVSNFEPLDPFLNWLDGFLESWLIAQTMNWHEATRRVKKRLAKIFNKRTPNRTFESLEVPEENVEDIMGAGPLSSKELEKVCARIDSNLPATIPTLPKFPNLHQAYNQGHIIGPHGAQKFCANNG